MTHADYQKRLEGIIKRIDPLKTEDNPEGNPFFLHNISVLEAQQALTALCRDVCGEAKPELPATFAALDDFGVMMYKKAASEYEMNIQAILGQPQEDKNEC